MFFELNAQPQHLGVAQLSYATVQHDQIRVIDMDTNSRQSNVAFLLVVRCQFEESTINDGRQIYFSFGDPDYSCLAFENWCIIKFRAINF